MERPRAGRDARGRRRRLAKVLALAACLLGSHLGFLCTGVLPRSQERGGRWISQARRSLLARHAWSDYTVAELKGFLAERGLKVSGRKAELVERLEEDEASGTAVKEDAPKKSAPSPAAASPASALPADGPVEYKAGQLALAKFHEDQRYYSVKLKKDNGDGSWDIVWLEDEAEDVAQVEDLKPGKDFKKGDLVVAKCNEDGNRYTALVQETNGEGYVTVQYLEDESEEEVMLDNVWLQRKKFKKGQKIEAKFPDDGEWYPATVKDSVGPGKYTVEWEDPDGGDAEADLLVDDLQVPRVKIDTLTVGQKLQGEVKRVVTFGAFVDVGCYTDGLVHISKMAKERVENPEDYVHEEQEITVWVTSINPEENKLGLTMVEGKLDFRERRSREVTRSIADLEIGDELEGTVESVREFGAFVDVGAERSGLVHISRMSEGFVDDPHDHVSEGQKVTVWISSIDGDRLGLSMVQSRV